MSSSSSASDGLPAAQDVDFSADGHLREAPLTSQRVYRGHFLDVRRDEVRLPDGKRAPREYIVHPGAVMIVPLFDDGRVLMERQFRYPVGRAMVEFPAGKLDPGESVQRCAARELAEETGFRAQEWARAGLIHPVIGYANEIIEIWFARGLEPGERHLDEGEFLDLFVATPRQLEAWLQDGRLTDAKTISGLYWLNLLNSGAWQPAWTRFESIS